MLSHDGPTRGYHVNVWGYLLELMVEDGPLSLEANGRLPDHLAAKYGKRSVWPATMMHAAFAHLVQLGMVSVSSDGDGRFIATVCLDRLADRLRNELNLARRNPGHNSELRTLAYFRTRKLCYKLPWLERIFEEVAAERGVEP